MSLFRTRYVWILTSFVLAIGYIVSCTKNDQVLNVTPTNPGTDLISLRTSTAPTIDGTIDAAWNAASKLGIVPTVPDPGNGLFTGYNGQQYSATLRSMYDANNIYFLLEIQDANQSTSVSPWYFDPILNVTGKTGWQKEPSSKTFDANGVITRDGWGEDKFAMLWNIDYSTPKFLTQTCYASCHVFTPYTDYSVTPAVVKSNANSGNHYTNGGSEKIDMWWGRLGFINRDASLNQLDDNYQDWAGGPGVTGLVGGSGNGRHVDGITVTGAGTTFPFAPTYSTSPTQGEVNNSQSLKLDGTGASVNVPIWVIPGSNTNFIIVSDTTTAKAKKVTAVSSAGVLTLSDGSSIDPNTSKEYQRPDNSATGGTAAKAIAGFIAVPLIGGRADIKCAAVFSATGWTIEYQRALKTSDNLKQDVDFSSLQDQQFGLAIWNKSNNQHGIQPNLLLKFQK